MAKRREMASLIFLFHIRQYKNFSFSVFDYPNAVVRLCQSVLTLKGPVESTHSHLLPSAVLKR